MSAYDGAWKAAIFRFPAVLRAARLVKAIKYRLLPSIHDDDFRALTTIAAERGLALDIGANQGQSASAILSLKPRFEVMSFEPNPDCAPTLRLLQRLFGQRLQVVHAGVSDRKGTFSFFVPKRNNRLLLEEGSFDRAALATPQAQVRMGKAGVDFEVEELTCTTVVIDDLDLEPAFVKLDVQGLELSAMRGMMKTLSRCRPLLMVEGGADEGEILALVADLGYVKRYWKGGAFVDAPAPGSANYFLVPT